MRIQHNIMAMNAYRNYTNNVSAMKSNLEKLSSGYKINRAGDDAAGLAISEKMRAQITGLQTAQKNAKDGISLVQTAEGALTEVHDMLNRMVELATQSANGTYDNTTDRAQLQKEVDQLRDEINRIADSSNFNGIKLLDGSMAIVEGVEGSVTPGTTQADYTGMDRIIESTIGKGEQAWEVAGAKTVLDGDGATATVAKFEVDLKTLDFSSPKSYSIAASGTMATFSITYKGSTGTVATTVKIKASTVKLGSTAPASNAPLVVKAGDVLTAKASIGGSEVDIKITVGANGKLYASFGSGVSGSSIGSVTNVAFTGTGSLTTVASEVEVKEVITVKINNTKLSTGSAGFTISGSANSEAIASAVAAAIAQNEGGIVEINGVKWGVSASGTKLKFEQIQVPDTKDKARANFDVSVSIKAAAATTGTAKTTDDFKITLGGDSVTTTTDKAGNVSMAASIKVGTYVTQVGVAKEDANKANTVFNIKAEDITDGTKIAIGTRTLTLSVGPDSTVDKTKVSKASAGSDGYVEIGANDDLNTALCKISNALGSSVKFLIKDSKGETQYVDFQIGVSDGKQGFPTGLTVQRVNTAAADASSTGSEAVKFDSLDKLAANFKMRVNESTSTVVEEVKAQKGLRLQIGDTADSFNQLVVSIGDMHTSSLGLADISIADQESAAAAVDAIKAAINKVSDVRGTLGATQNRLDHTINNLSVMTENIQDAESTIRDTDVADEMMAYTKNNILIQSAQAMLAQANQVPQGVLQLLQ